MSKKFVFQRKGFTLISFNTLRWGGSYQGTQLSNSLIVINNTKIRRILFCLPSKLTFKKISQESFLFFYSGVCSAPFLANFFSSLSLYGSLFTQKKLYKVSISGIGYKLEKTSHPNFVRISIGFSHYVYFYLPPTIQVSFTKNSGLFLIGSDSQELGEVCSKLKALRKADVYKGKGIFSQNLANTKMKKKIPLKLGKTKK